MPQCALAALLQHNSHAFFFSFDFLSPSTKRKHTPPIPLSSLVIMCTLCSMLHICNIVIYSAKSLLRWVALASSSGAHTSIFIYALQDETNITDPTQGNSHFIILYFFKGSTWLWFRCIRFLFSNIIHRIHFTVVPVYSQDTLLKKTTTKNSKVVKIINGSCFHYVGSFHFTCPEHLLSDGAQWTKLVG